MRPYSLTSLLRILPLLVLLGCTTWTAIQSLTVDIPETKLKVPDGNYKEIIRFSDGKVLLGQKDREDNISRYYNLQEQEYIEIPTPSDDRCQGTLYDLPVALPDDRLGLRMSCFAYGPDRPPGKRGAFFVVAYDWETGEFEQLVEEPLSNESYGFTWNPEMTRGVQSLGSLLGTIQWITPEGTEPITLMLGEGRKSWQLDENLTILEEDLDRRDVGIARSPAWSPDGKHIAFLASPDAVGREGFARATAKYNLYLLDPNTLQTKIILTAITNTRPSSSLVWSPDSQWLLMDIELINTDGLWLSSIDGKILQFIDNESDGRIQAMAWIDNQTVIASKCKSLEIGPCPGSNVFKYDVSQITQRGK